MNTYLIVKWLHILSSVVLVGTGFGTAFYLFFANRSGVVATEHDRHGASRTCQRSGTARVVLALCPLVGMPGLPCVCGHAGRLLPDGRQARPVSPQRLTSKSEIA